MEYVYKFKKPIQFLGGEYREIDFSKLADMKGSDLHDTLTTAEQVEGRKLRLEEVASFPYLAEAASGVGMPFFKQLLNKIAADYDGTYKQVLQAYAAKELTGEMLLPLPDAGERRTYTATEIGEMLGGITKNKVGTLAKANGLKTDEYGKWFHDKSPHGAKEVEAFRYYDNVIPALQALMQ